MFLNAYKYVVSIKYEGDTKMHVPYHSTPPRHYPVVDRCTSNFLINYRLYSVLLKGYPVIIAFYLAVPKDIFLEH